MAPTTPLSVSATLAANEALDARRRRGERVLPLAFGEAGLPPHPRLRNALAEGAGRNDYGPVAGHASLREAAAGYWARRGLPTSPGEVVCGPGSKALLFGLLLGLGTDVAVARPSWVSYAAQASLAGSRAVHVPAAAGQGGVPDPEALGRAVVAARAAGRRLGAVIVTLPDNPTGRLAGADTVHGLCDVARRHDLMIISDEIYRDLVHSPADGGSAFLSPAAIAPDRTVITTGLSKNLALGGWRIGVARLPGRLIRDRLLGICSEIWSAPAGPVQEAAALAFGEPEDITERIARSRALHGCVARAVASRFAGAGAVVPAPQAAFYVYPDFAPHRALLSRRYDVTTGAALAALLLERYGIGVLPGSAFGEPVEELRLRVATSRLYGEAEWQQETALRSASPLALPWISASLDWLEEALRDLGGVAQKATPPNPPGPLRRSP
ncbi:MAG: pyridoxal phosphate-dependent aminotransferase [Streptosporangiaceae bacterium]|nr:pyridoxal phosphate-dependent aminotransferase [Streptosporangiaceae bacterium]